MGFPQDQEVKYDPHQVISKRRTTLKCRPFEHTKVPGLREKVNWDDFPNTVPVDTSAKQDSSSQLPGANPPQQDLVAVVAIAGGYS